MRRYIIILLCLIGIQVYAVDYVPYVVAATAPVASMQSVNHTSRMSAGNTFSASVASMQSVNHIAYMSSGSTYRSKVYDVNCSASTTGRGVRKAPPGTDGSGYDPNNPQFAPIGNSIIPLLIMALIYMIVAYRRKTKVSDLCI